MTGNGSHPERLRQFYADDLRVLAKGNSGIPESWCEATSRNRAKRIAAALNLYVPKSERRAVNRRQLAENVKSGDVRRHFTPKLR